MEKPGWLKFGLIGGFAILFLLAAMPLEAGAQAWLAYVSLFLLFLLRPFRQSKFARILLFLMRGFDSNGGLNRG